MERGSRSLPPPQRAGLIRRRIEVALEQLIRLREGQFNFELAEEIPAFVNTHDITDETLLLGINPQELVLDLTRGMDEDADPPPRSRLFAEPVPECWPRRPPFRRGEAAHPTSPIPWASPSTKSRPRRRRPDAAPPAAPAEDIRVISVDDGTRSVRCWPSTHRVGIQGVRRTTLSAVKKAGKLGKGGIEFLLVTDLGMPTSGGGSFQGGFEVVKRMWKMKLHPPVLMMAETLGPALQARAKQMGISNFVFKPGLSKLDPQQFRAYLSASPTRCGAGFPGDAAVRVSAPGARPAAPPSRAATPEIRGSRDPARASRSAPAPRRTQISIW